MRGIKTMAVIVVREGGQDAAVGRRTAAAGRDHPRKLGAQGVEPAQLSLHRYQLVAGDPMRRFAGRLIGARGEIEQPADRIERKAEFPGVADEIQTLQFRRAVHPMSAGGAHGPGQEADLFVPADGLYLAAGAPREGANGKGCLGHGAKIAPKGLNLQWLEVPSCGRPPSRPHDHD